MAPNQFFCQILGTLMTWNAVEWCLINPHNACDSQLPETGGSSRSALILIVCSGCNPISDDVSENIRLHLPATKPWWNNPCIIVSLGIWNWCPWALPLHAKPCSLVADSPEKNCDLPTAAENKTFNRIRDYISCSLIVPKNLFSSSKTLLEKNL